MSALSNLGLDFELEGSKIRVHDIASIDNATENDLAFCWYVGQKGLSHISGSKAGVILCKKEMQGIAHPKSGQLLVFMDNPRLAFVRLAREMRGQDQLVGISPRAFISEKSKIGSGCYIGHYAVIGDNCSIGDNTVIYDRVSLVQNCKIGNNCVIQSGASLGSDGFAFERYEGGELEIFPHKGYVRLGNNVEIYTNCSIARGSLSDTWIGDGTKLDALVHVAHNVNVGKNCELTAGTIIGGSTSIGDTSWTGLNSTLKNGIKIGRNVIVASGASVIQDIPDGDIVAGVPARSIKHK
ncbi:MAG TPA: DapH/DapD/GlmU-related protein, partial [Nitrososphaera sp.]|nr:DapH/DapD/GlmU-related protein [Nitrososphaera sp.]